MIRISLASVVLAFTVAVVVATKPGVAPDVLHWFVSWACLSGAALALATIVRAIADWLDR